ncbi:putative flavin-containing protein [Fusarium bulbicola]|nr:putative flavin-containing protein [Fusarium bulbicola]
MSDLAETNSQIPPAAAYPEAGLPKNINLEDVPAEWVKSFGKLIHSQDPALADDAFIQESFWRDHLCFSWDFHTLHGHREVISFLKRQRQDFLLQRISVDMDCPDKKAKLAAIDHNGKVRGIQFYIDIETSCGIGKGLVRMLYELKSRKWKAFTVYTALREIRGHEETVKNKRVTGLLYKRSGASIAFDAWQSIKTAPKDDFADSMEPTVLIIGSGQAGLACGARLLQLGIQCLIIDRNSEVGDNWRNRYSRLVLHDPVWYNHMPYLPFPSNWPIFAPREKLAAWMQAYARIMDLSVWTSTTVLRAEWEGAYWNVTLERKTQDGPRQMRQLRPRHIIQATGVNGEPKIPRVEGMATFQGRVCHSSQFSSAQPTATTGKHAVVVGTGVSGHDIAQEFSECGYDVTMIQRSPTCVDPSDYVHGQGLYSEDGPPTDDADFLTHSVPFPLLKRREIEKTDQVMLQNKEYFDSLEKVGFRVDRGPDGGGRKLKFLQYAGGSYIDVGASKLVIDGKIQIKQGIVAMIKPHSLILDSGIELPADEIVFATGYTSMLETTKEIMGAEFSSHLQEVWGIDKEGELRSVWRRSGHPGYWFAGGNLALCRYFSKLLALQIKAVDQGMMRYSH